VTQTPPPEPEVPDDPVPPDPEVVPDPEPVPVPVPDPVVPLPVLPVPAGVPEPADPEADVVPVPLAVPEPADPGEADPVEPAPVWPGTEPGWVTPGVSTAGSPAEAAESPDAGCWREASWLGAMPPRDERPGSPAGGAALRLARGTDDVGPGVTPPTTGLRSDDFGAGRT
jgi:hypothetical protein